MPEQAPEPIGTILARKLRELRVVPKVDRCGERSKIPEEVPVAIGAHQNQLGISSV